MKNIETKAIDRSALPDSFLSLERQKSHLILEANLLQQQQLYPAAADKFAAAAEIEEQLTQMVFAQGKQEKAFLHHMSAISCWVQAGDLHRALGLGQQLLSVEELSTTQRSQIESYISTLQNRMAQWMGQWAPHSFSAAD